MRILPILAAAAIPVVFADNLVSLPLRKRHAERTPEHLARLVQQLKNKWGKGSRNRGGTGLSRRASTVNVPLDNEDIDSAYSSIITVGTPPVEYEVSLDTGSSDLWLASTGCQSRACSGVKLYDPSSSSTYQNKQTPIQVVYGSGEVEGTAATETVSIAGLTVQGQAFATATRLTANLLAENDTGLMGLAFESIAELQAPPLWQSLFTGGQLSQPQMSFALSRFDTDPNAAADEPGGTFTLGGTDSSLFTGSIDFVDVVAPDAFWTLPLTAITINGQNVPISGQQAVIDTGTTLMAGPTDIVNQIYQLIPGSQSGSNVEGLVAIPCNQPVTMTVTFGSKTWTISPDDFNAGNLDGFGETCAGALSPQDAQDIGGGPQWILGDTFLKNVYSVFQFQPPQVGFAQLSAAGSIGPSDTSGASAGENPVQTLNPGLPSVTVVTIFSGPSGEPLFGSGESVRLGPVGRWLVPLVTAVSAVFFGVVVMAH